MPQDGRKLAKYSPFVTCNDPKGVVECGTIRKSKLSSYQTMEPRTDNQTKFKNPNRAVASITNEKDRGDDLRGRVSLQLSEVSKGAEKLNHMIDSWSMNLAVEGQPKDLAKDLLKGAIDLQESLMMLGKLQAASKYVSKLKKKQEKSNNNGGQEGRGFRKQEELSKEKIEELKEIIRSSFERQNLLRGGNGGKGHFDQFDQEPDVPSTSSRHSSSSYNEKIDGKLEKSIAKGPGIIAKLMGLEEISSKPMQKKPLFNTEMQMTKLKDRICEVSNGEKKKKKKTLKEVLDTMHLKGILKGNSVNSHRVSRNTDMMRPIVLIKPLQIPPPENDEVKTVEFCKEKEEKVKPSKPSNPKQLRREVSNKKPSENEKKKMSDRRSLEKGMAQNHANKTVKFESKPKVVVAKKGNDSSKERKENGQKQRKQLRMHQSDQKKIRKIDQQTVNEPKEAKLAKEDAIKINSSSEIDIGIDMNSIHTNQQSIEVIQDASGSRICGGIDLDDAEEITSVKGYDYGNRRSLLLSSQSFVTRAEDLFSFTSSCSPTNSEKPDSQSPNTRLYIDCATELIERKSLHASETHCLILPWYLRSSTAICISMEKLVEEVCDGVEILSSYWSLQSHSSPVDGLYAVLKRDLNQNRRMVGSKLWDMGWNKVFSSDDFDKVVIELEEIIFSCLIEELFRGQI